MDGTDVVVVVDVDVGLVGVVVLVVGPVPCIH